MAWEGAYRTQGENMKDAVKFTWSGGSKHEAGIAVYEVGTSTYTIRFSTPRPANLVHMALQDAYREGYERGFYSAKADAQSESSKP
jgi:hypothetical protein